MGKRGNGSTLAVEDSILKLDFGEDNAFELDLRGRVREYFLSVARCPETGNWKMYLKSAIVMASFFASYVLLVFFAQNVWQGLLLVVWLGFSTAGIGFNIGHDGGHRAYSKKKWINKLTALSMDFAGASSYIWFWRHAVIHHRFVNITGYDHDINLGVLGRLSPHQKWMPYFRWQHLYIWFLYGFLAFKWEFVEDFTCVIIGKIGEHRFPRPKGWDLFTFFAGKLVFFSWAMIIPLLFHPAYVVLFFYFVGVFVLGMTLSLIFQLPHVVGESDFPLPSQETGSMDNSWANHQASVTADFGWESPVMSYFIGGLNYHLEHHLLPTVCHIHYASLTKIVEETCEDHGLTYYKHKSFWTGLAAHYRWLKKMGKRPVAVS